jgi:hypothetical protein
MRPEVNDARYRFADRGFNEVRPHSSLGELTPAEFKRRLSTTNPKFPGRSKELSPKPSVVRRKAAGQSGKLRECVG